jgi:WD40 repeat protein
VIVLKGRRRGGDVLAFSPDGKTLASRYEGGLQLWRGLPNPEYAAIPTGTVGWIQFTPDGERLFLEGPESRVYDLARGSFTEVPKPETEWRFQSLSRDGRVVVAACVSRDRPAVRSACWLHCWAAELVGVGPARWSVRVPRGSASRPLFLPDGRFLVMESQRNPESGRWTYWWVRRSKTGKPQAESAPLEWGLDWEAVSPDGRWVAGARYNQAAVWSVADLARPPVELQNDSRNNFTDLAFHPSSCFLAVTSNDRTVKLYDTATWAVAKTFTWDIGRMKAVAFSPDGTLAAAGSDTGRVVVWDVDL